MGLLNKGGADMLISTKGRYALRVMIDLAEHQADGVVPLKVIAERQGISEKYLESIIKLLVKARLLNGLRGKGGGYKLTKAPEQYTVGSILRLTEDSLAPVSCLEQGADACPRAAECRTLSLWKGLDKVINDYLGNVTIADLMRSGSDGFDYVI
jgi:Rrf2 family iron-sulfur cluster assembly transcriptional regulator